MNDPRTLEIIVQVVYKSLSEKGAVNFAEVEAHTQSLLGVINKLSQKQEVPFHNPPARGERAVGDPCGICSSPLKASKQPGGKPWCLTCWKNKKGN